MQSAWPGPPGSTWSDTWDIATMGVRAEARSNRLMVTMGLYHAMMKGFRVNEMTSATAISTCMPSA